MIGNLTKKILKSASKGPMTYNGIIRKFGGPNPGMQTAPYPRDEKSGYFIDPEEAARRVIKIVAAHPEAPVDMPITLEATWFNLGISDLGKVEIFLEIENEFDVQFADENVERSGNLRDAVEYVSRSFFAH